MVNHNKNSSLDEQALRLHARYPAGKLEIVPTKHLANQRDLALAYSPGVAAPCRAIAEDKSQAMKYTAKGNLVAVVSNGTAVLGLGNLGALASKPVMEGKSVLFKRFADIDSIDIEVDTENVDEFVNAISLIGDTFGGINLEDIKAPQCFEIEEKLQAKLDIPVFHDDQHGTAVITLAGVINALRLTDRDAKTTKFVMNGAGAASIACANLIKSLGVPRDNLIMCDSRGVIYQGREDGMNKYKEKHAANTDARTLEQALQGADVFIGLSIKDVVSQAMVKSMAAKPIVFAMANPDPEIKPEDVYAVVPDAIVATGRSDFPNQVNNVLGFPYIFRGALDVEASTVNDEMKVAAAQAIAELATQAVTEEVAQAYGKNDLKFGQSYLIPTPFDSRLMTNVPVAVAKAAMDSGVARNPITDLDAYAKKLEARLDPAMTTMQVLMQKAHNSGKKIVFAEAYAKQSALKAALSFYDNAFGIPVLVEKNKGEIATMLQKIGREDILDSEVIIMSMADDKLVNRFVDTYYQKMQRQGMVREMCLGEVANDPVIFAANIVSHGLGDGMVAGMTSHTNHVYEAVNSIIGSGDDAMTMPVGVSIIFQRNKLLFIADTAINNHLDSASLAQISKNMASIIRMFGLEPRIAFISRSTYGNLDHLDNFTIGEAITILDQQGLDFKYDGPMSPDVALNQKLLDEFEFNTLGSEANCLITCDIDSAHMLANFASGMGSSGASRVKVLGPLLFGFNKPVQIISPNARQSDIITSAVLAVLQAT
jgi:malate dehydrogenase (oxaloacetate-decarboxylating)(NADP+)